MGTLKTTLGAPLWLRHRFTPGDERFAGLPPPMPGQVYFLWSSLGTKIGCGTDARRRVASIAASLPFETRLEHMIQTDDCFGLEHAFHFYFADQHVRAEWFALSAEQIAFIKTLDGPPPSDR